MGWRAFFQIKYSRRNLYYSAASWRKSQLSPEKREYLEERGTEGGCIYKITNTQPDEKLQHFQPCNSMKHIILVAQCIYPETKLALEFNLKKQKKKKEKEEERKFNPWASCFYAETKLNDKISCFLVVKRIALIWIYV